MGSKPKKLGIRTAAPLATAAILIVMLFSGGVEAVSTEQTTSYHAKVKQLVEQIPYKIGPWIGKDVAAPPAAVKILKPNALLQRRFTNPATGQTFSLLVVHCGDVRDMQGHWPPICYPAHGWELTETQQTALAVPGSMIPASEYDFRRVVDGFEQTMNVIGFFVVPEGDAEIVSSYNALTSASKQRTRAGLGAAQIQLVSGSDLNEAQRHEISQEFVQAIEPLIQVIAGGVHGG